MRLFAEIIVILLFTGLLAKVIIEPPEYFIHDHRTYQFTWNFQPKTFTTCADSALVRKQDSKHVDIPDFYEQYIKPKYLKKQ